ncbi:diuretic hormone class 2 isoform X1 [Leptinotarsa decemlineata]|uniref:diuretic hormone class 2 isoform X1 n=1 Tax=Leptinotarsa decemlineata TaxID=7539 RepID=UPI003D307E21
MRSSMIHSNGTSIFMILLVGIVLFEITTTSAAPRQARYYPGYYSLEAQNPDYLLQTIARLRQALINDDDLENVSSKRSTYQKSSISKNEEDHHENQNKRVIDLGTQSRGYSGKMENMYLTNADMLRRIGKRTSFERSYN